MDSFDARPSRTVVVTANGFDVHLYGRFSGEEDEPAFLDAEDISLLLYAYQLRVGKLTRGTTPIALSHLVIDEVQDFSPLEILILLDVCDDKQSVTLAGDTRQHISNPPGFRLGLIS